MLPPQAKKGKKGKKGQLIAKKQSPITTKVLKARAHLCDMLELIHDVNSVVRDRITRRQVRNWGEATRCVQYPGVREP